MQSRGFRGSRGLQCFCKLPPFQTTPFQHRGAAWMSTWFLTKVLLNRHPPSSRTCQGKPLGHCLPFVEGVQVFSLLSPYSEKQTEHKDKLLGPDSFVWSEGLPFEGPQGVGISLEAQGTQTFWRDIPRKVPDITPIRGAHEV